LARYINFNANPKNNRVGDCTVRAIAKAMDKDWETIYANLALFGYICSDMPSANAVWGKYLKSQGFRRYIVDDGDKEWYTVIDFCNDHPEGTYILALSSHVVAVENGCYFDTWDSGYESPIYYWAKEEDKTK
jgi:hypothetical protein